MLLEPIVLECPQCGQKYDHYNLLSYNTFGVNDCWSDGICGSLSNGFAFAACDKCKHVFWLSDATQFPVNDDEKFPSLNYPAYSEQDMDKLMDGVLITETIVLEDIKKLLARQPDQQNEYYLRLAAIQLINNAQRFKSTANRQWFARQQDFYTENLSGLIGIIEQFRNQTVDIDDEVYELEIEMNRLAGNFAKAKKLLDAVPLDVYRENQDFFKKSKRKVLFRNHKVFKL